MLKSKNRKEPVEATKRASRRIKTTVGFDQYHGRAGGAATVVFCRASYLENLPFDLAIDQSRHNMVQLDQMSDLFPSDPA